MLAVQRKKEIIEKVQKYGVVKVADLSELFNTSEVTIRKDLRDLEEEKYLKRTYGGAVNIYDPSYELSIAELSKMNIEEKIAIANKAYDYINDSDSILLGSSTTVQELAKIIAKGRKKDLLILTNSISIAEILIVNSDIEVVLLGGNMQKNSMAVSGYWVNRMLSETKVDKAFLGTNGISFENGYTTPKYDVCEVKKKMIESANQTYVLSDYSKIGQVYLTKICDLVDIDTLIIDERISEVQVEKFSKCGINVTVANIMK